MRLECRLAKDKGKFEVASNFVCERQRNVDDRSGGFGRGPAESFDLSVRWETRVRGRTPYAGSVIKRYRQVVFSVTERGLSIDDEGSECGSKDTQDDDHEQRKLEG